jgi:hypothetical protein
VFYEYDFGGSWLHRLELVSRRPADGASPQARLIDGAKRGPLEDSGGFPGYEEIMDALADPSHPDDAEQTAWIPDITGTDEAFDPAYLDISAVNRGAGWAVLRSLSCGRERHDRWQETAPFAGAPPPCFKRR